MFESKNFRIIKSRPTRNHRDQYFEKNLRKTRLNFTKNLKNSDKNLKKNFRENF